MNKTFRDQSIEDDMRRAFDSYIDSVVSVQLNGIVPDELRRLMWCVWLDGANYGVVASNNIFA